MKIKETIANFTYNSLKILFCIVCYLVTLLFAICSGYFTIVFYASTQSETNQLIIGLLAGLFEFMKFILAIAYPFMAYRNLEIENRVRRILLIALFMSIMASLYFFLESGDVVRSPASRIISLIYSYMPILKILPIKFSQFITTMSLSVIIEVLIIKIPSIAPVFYFEKDYTRKKTVITNWDKLRDVVVSIPNRFIDRLYEKYVSSPENEEIYIKDKSTEIQEYPKGKKSLEAKNVLLISSPDVNIGMTDEENESLEADNNNELAENKPEPFGYTKDEEIDEYLKIMYENSKDNISIGQTQLVNLTGFSELKIKLIKKVLKNLEILETKGARTLILVDYETAIKKLAEGVNATAK